MHAEKVHNPLLTKLLHYVRLRDAGCPLGRHELSDPEWLDLGRVKAEWERLEMEYWKERRA